MQLPKLLSRFFQNDGAGDKLLKEIMYEALTVGDDDNPICLKDGVLETCHNVGNVDSNISVTGYIKYSNGLIIQWANLYDLEVPYEVTFPISFTLPPVIAASTTVTSYLSVYNTSVTGFTVTSSITISTFRYIAIGR